MENARGFGKSYDGYGRVKIILKEDYTPAPISVISLVDASPGLSQIKIYDNQNYRKKLSNHPRRHCSLFGKNEYLSFYSLARAKQPIALKCISSAKMVLLRPRS